MKVSFACYRVPRPSPGTLLWLSIVVTLSTFVAIPAQCQALKQYRCNGRIQYRPCEPQAEVPSSARVRAAKAPTGSFARVTESTFTPSKKGLGLWRGAVHGNGFVELALKIFRRGNLESTRYMGHIPLRNKSTTFHFHAPLPHGKEWTWQVVAWAS